MVKHLKEDPLTLWEKLGLSIFVLALILSILSMVMENSGPCDEYGKSFWGAGYYDYTQTMTLCEDCARTYWAPFSYKDFKR
ncbi:hypothetical protein D7V91_09385 [bacterium 1xD42-67]|nr:hypothetical protein D7V91_09385 [bacterium 1xD42-67]